MKPPARPAPLSKLLRELSPERLLALVAATAVRSAATEPYLPWDKIRFKSPPDGLTREEWWISIKLARSGMQRALPLKDENGVHFSYAIPDEVLRLLNEIDRHASGQITLGEEVTNPSTRDRYIVNSLIEEAINSSQLEGASTTRQVAKEMIKTGRQPRDKSERMVLNNYRVMLKARDLQKEKLTPELVLELHRVVTEGTLDNPEAAGRIQNEGEPRVAIFDNFGSLLHAPPPAGELRDRLTLMCGFANGEVGDEVYVHPVVRAIILHFWLGYDHPFEDGNGRTARAIFYWSMLSQGYWLAEFLSISRILKKAPAQYARSFLYTETDENDLTYFIVYQLNVVRRAIVDLREYLRKKMTEIRDVRQLLDSSGASFNHRQLALLTAATRDPDATFTIASHALSHNVVHETARNDLRNLEERGFLRRETRGHTFWYRPVADLAQRLKQL